jgi:purine-binding chemotaxis protein CheW
MNIDWKEIHRRLEVTRNTTERGTARTPAEIRKILHARAQAFAREAADIDKDESMDVLQFQVATENYAVELPFIQDVCPLKAYTALPGTPPFVLGIVNVRGQVYSVIDIKKFFELPDKGLGDLNKVIIVQHDGIEFGILADVIHGIRKVILKDIQPPLPTLTGIRLDYLRGITSDQLIILDAETLLTDKKLIVNEA